MEMKRRKKKKKNFSQVPSCARFSPLVDDLGVIVPGQGLPRERRGHPMLPGATNVIDRGSATGNNAAAIHQKRPFKPLPRCRAICIVNHRAPRCIDPQDTPLLMVAGSFAERVMGLRRLIAITWNAKRGGGTKPLKVFSRREVSFSSPRDGIDFSKFSKFLQNNSNGN